MRVLTGRYWSYFSKLFSSAAKLFVPDYDRYRKPDAAETSPLPMTLEEVDHLTKMTNMVDYGGFAHVITKVHK